MESDKRYFLPSEIARLVLGYLQTECYTNTYKSLLRECPHLEEYVILLRRGQTYPLTINGFTLIQMLEEYAYLKVTGTERRQHDPSASNLWKQFDSLVNCLKIQTSSRNLRVDGKPQNARMRTQRILSSRGLPHTNISNVSPDKEVDSSSKEDNVTILSPSCFRASRHDELRDSENISIHTDNHAVVPSTSCFDVADSTSCDFDTHVDSTSVNDDHMDTDIPRTCSVTELSNLRTVESESPSSVKMMDAENSAINTSSHSKQKTLDSFQNSTRNASVLENFQQSPRSSTVIGDNFQNNSRKTSTNLTEFAKSCPSSPYINNINLTNSVPAVLSYGSVHSPALISTSTCDILPTTSSLVDTMSTNPPLHTEEAVPVVTLVDESFVSKQLESIAAGSPFIKQNQRENESSSIVPSTFSEAQQSKLNVEVENLNTKQEMSAPANNSVKKLSENELEKAKDLHKSPRRKRPPRKCSLERKAGTKLDFSQHNESSNSNDGSTMTQDDSLTTMIYEQLLNSTELQEKLAENINKRLKDTHKKPQRDVKGDPSKTKPDEDVVQEPVRDKNSFTPSHSLEDILDPQNQMTNDQINEIIEMTSNDPLFDSLLHLFDIDKSDYTDDSANGSKDDKDLLNMDSKIDQNKGVENWINSETDQNSANIPLMNSFQDLPVPLSNSQQLESSVTTQPITSCVLSSSTQTVQSVTSYSSSSQPMHEGLTCQLRMPSSTSVIQADVSSHIVTPGATSNFSAAPSSSDLTSYSTTLVTSSEGCVPVTKTGKQFETIQTTVTQSSHGFPVLSIKSLSASDDENNDDTDFPMTQDVPIILTPTTSKQEQLTLTTQIPVTSPPYSVTSSQVLMTSAGTASVSSTMCNLSSVPSVKESKSNSYISFVKGMDSNQNSSTPVMGRTSPVVTGLLENTLAFLGQPADNSMDSSQKPGENKEDNKEFNGRKERGQGRRSRGSAKSVERKRLKTTSTSSWSSCLSALIDIASPEKNQQNDKEIYTKGKEKSKTSQSGNKKCEKEAEKDKSLKAFLTAISPGLKSVKPVSVVSTSGSDPVVRDSGAYNMIVKPGLPVIVNAEPLLSMPVMSSNSASIGNANSVINVENKTNANVQGSQESKVVQTCSLETTSNTTYTQIKGNPERKSSQKKSIHDISDIDFLNSPDKEGYYFTSANTETSDNGMIGKDKEESQENTEIIYTAIPIGKAKPKDIHVRSLDFGEIITSNVTGLNNQPRGKKVRLNRIRRQLSDSPTTRSGQLTRQPTFGRGRRGKINDQKNLIGSLQNASDIEDLIPDSSGYVYATDDTKNFSCDSDSNNSSKFQSVMKVNDVKLKQTVLQKTNLDYTPKASDQVYVDSVVRNNKVSESRNTNLNLNIGNIGKIKSVSKGPKVMFSVSSGVKENMHPVRVEVGSSQVGIQQKCNSLTGLSVESSKSDNTKKPTSQVSGISNSNPYSDIYTNSVNSLQSTKNQILEPGYVHYSDISDSNVSDCEPVKVSHCEPITDGRLGNTVSSTEIPIDHLNVNKTISGRNSSVGLNSGQSKSKLIQISDFHGRNVTIPAECDSENSPLVHNKLLNNVKLQQNDVESSEDEIDIEGDWENPWDKSSCDQKIDNENKTITGDDSNSDSTIPADDGPQNTHSDNSGLSVCDKFSKNMHIGSRVGQQDGSNDIVTPGKSNSQGFVYAKCSPSVYQTKPTRNSSSFLVQNKTSNTPVFQQIHKVMEKGNIVTVSDNLNSSYSSLRSKKIQTVVFPRKSLFDTSAGNSFHSPKKVEHEKTASPSNPVFSIGGKSSNVLEGKNSSPCTFDQNKSPFICYRVHTEDSHSRTSVDSHQSDAPSVSSQCSYQSATSMADFMRTPPKKRITASMKSGNGLYFISRQSKPEAAINTKVKSPKKQKTPQKKKELTDKYELARRSPRLKGMTDSPRKQPEVTQRSEVKQSPRKQGRPRNDASISKSEKSSSLKILSKESLKQLQEISKESSVSNSVVGNGGQKRPREDNSILSPQSPVKKKKKVKKPYDLGKLNIEKFLSKIHKS